MHQHTSIGNIISMELSNLEIIDNNRLIKLFAVGVCNRSSSAVSKSKDITRK